VEVIIEDENSDELTEPAAYFNGRSFARELETKSEYFPIVLQNE